MDSQLQEEHQVVEKGNLPTRNFLTRISELKLESGTTGAARTRRIPLFSDLNTGAVSITDEGSIIDIYHVRLADSVTDTVYYTPVVLPSDFIRGGFPTVHYLYSNDVTTGDVLWVVRVVSIGDAEVGVTSILSDSLAITVSGVADTLVERSVGFDVKIPERNTVLAVSIKRTGGDGSDTSTGIASVWSAWIEYLAHS